ncbi:MAG: hypothetical protein HY735_19040 [Verrucomicrobia bacterium]|nr:hypothetical protein [Verrucomicrobiota bacterium]
MSTNDPNETVFYNSRYRFGVDAKRRVQIPAKWRSDKGETHFFLILWPKGNQQEACLLALPPGQWSNLVKKLSELPFADPKTETLRRLVGTKSDKVTLDKVGRICLPDWMAKAAGLEKEAVLVGLVDRFQIWNPERYEATSVVDEQLSGEAFQLV